jgi:hypothetical protein
MFLTKTLPDDTSSPASCFSLFLDNFAQPKPTDELCACRYLQSSTDTYPSSPPRCVCVCTFRPRRMCGTLFEVDKSSGPVFGLLWSLCYSVSLLCRLEVADVAIVEVVFRVNLKAAQVHLVAGPFKEHSGNIQGTFKEHSEDIQGTFKEHLGNIQETLRRHSGHIQRTFRVHSGNTEPQGF